MKYSFSALDELTPRVAKAYAGKSGQTLRRDLEELEKLELVQRRPGKVRANRKIIHSFRPLRRRDEAPATSSGPELAPQRGG